MLPHVWPLVGVSVQSKPVDWTNRKGQHENIRNSSVTTAIDIRTDRLVSESTVHATGTHRTEASGCRIARILYTIEPILTMAVCSFTLENRITGLCCARYPKTF